MTGPGSFVHHNIVLPDGTQTKPDQPILQSTQACQGALRLADTLCTVDDRRVVDLGCLDGGYAVAFARAGYDVMGIDARQSNIDRCQWVADRLELPNLRFVCDDARHLGDHGPFDVVCCFGLLYHLDDPVTFLELLGKVTTRLLMIHGHVADRRDDAPSVATYRLGELTEHEGRQGRWYQEPAWATQDEMQRSSLSAWENPRSFWLTKPALMASIVQAGFPLALEQYDYQETIDVEPTAFDTHGLGSFVAIKP
jgi:SAM-dependent methyltransferase